MMQLDYELKIISLLVSPPYIYHLNKNDDERTNLLLRLHIFSDACG